MFSKKWRDGIPDLFVLAGLGALGFPIVFERLQASVFSCSRDAVLLIVEVVSMACVDGGRNAITGHPLEGLVEFSNLPVFTRQVPNLSTIRYHCND